MSKIGKHYPPETKVQQSRKNDNLPKHIVQKFAEGTLAPAPAPQFMDQYDIPTFHEAQNIVTSINQDFANQPSKIRARFQNSPTKLIEFCQDKKNINEAIELGLLQKLPSAPKEAQKTTTPKKEEVSK